MTKQETLQALSDKHERARAECIRLLEAVATSPGGSCTVDDGTPDRPFATRNLLAELSDQWKQMNGLAELTNLVHQLYNEGAAKPQTEGAVLQ